MYDVIAIGEVLIDFTYIGKSENEMKIFEQNPGGAPANVACAAAKLGAKTAFIGKVGNDMHGDFLIDTFKRCNVDTSGIIKDKEAFTTLAFVSLDENGERSFSFSRYKSADTRLMADDIDKEMIKNTKILHFGSLSLTDEPSKSAVIHAVKTAKQSGALISYDPNYRPLLWKSEDEAKKEMRAVLPLADIVKISDEETTLLCDTDNLEKAATKLHALGITTVIITLGKYGAYVSVKDYSVTAPAPAANVIDTTGAGDAFVGGFLYRIATDGNVTAENSTAYAEFANKVAAICVARRGAIQAMPDGSEII